MLPYIFVFLCSAFILFNIPSFAMEKPSETVSNSQGSQSIKIQREYITTEQSKAQKLVEESPQSMKPKAELSSIQLTLIGLPPDILDNILNHFHYPHELVPVAKTCHLLKDAAYNASVWRILVRNRGITVPKDKNVRAAFLTTLDSSQGNVQVDLNSNGTYKWISHRVFRTNVAEWTDVTLADCYDDGVDRPINEREAYARYTNLVAKSDFFGPLMTQIAIVRLAHLYYKGIYISSPSNHKTDDAFVQVIKSNYVSNAFKVLTTIQRCHWLICADTEKGWFRDKSIGLSSLLLETLSRIINIYKYHENFSWMADYAETVKHLAYCDRFIVEAGKVSYDKFLPVLQRIRTTTSHPQVRLLASFLFAHLVVHWHRNSSSDGSPPPLKDAYDTYTNIINDPLVYPSKKAKSQFARALLIPMLIEQENKDIFSQPLSSKEEVLKMFDHYINDLTLAPWVRLLAREKKQKFIVDYTKALKETRELAINLQANQLQHLGG